MNEEAENRQLIERIKILQKKRDEILSLPPEKALERILDDPNALELVHSFPEQDFYFLIHDIGPEDALPLLSLASNQQWEHIVDLETWQKDRIDNKSVTRWLNFLLEADPRRFLRWVLDEKLEFVEFYLFKNIEVRVREHDQDPSEFGDDFFSIDGVYYVRFIKTPIETEIDKLSDEQRREFINKFTQRLADFDHRTYQSVLLEATHVLPAETEEDNYRWRNVRLAAKGFLPFDEAIGIYQPIKPRDLKKQRAKQFFRSLEDEEIAMLPVPQYPLKVLKEDNHFTRALATFEPDAVLQQVQVEFANLCNQIIVADHKTIREREELREIVRKACGYISIGLERLSDDRKKVDPQRAGALIAKHPLHQIFKVGFGGALELKWRAEKWLSQCWFAQAGLRLTFWGEQWLGVLGGLLIKKPLFYDNYATGVLYREFISLDEIRQTESFFNQIKAVDELLSLMTINLASPASYGFLTYKNLILTLWARHYLGLSVKKVQPITLKQFKVFYETLLPGEPDADQLRTVPMEMKKSFLDWLSEDTGLKDYEITERVGQTFENLFTEIENEYGRVAAKDLDPRYVHLFLLAQTKK